MMDTLEPGSLPHERLALRVRGEAVKWRAWSARVDAAEQRLIAEGWPEAAMWNALVFAEANRLHWCGELLAVFGVDIETVKPVQEPTCYDEDRYTITAMCAIFWQQTSRALWKQYARAVHAGLPPARHVCEAYITAMRCKPVAANILMEASPLPRWREEGAVTTSGWAGTELSLHRSRRLAASLAAGGTSPWEALWLELPGATLQACSDLPPEKRGPKELRNHIANLLSSDARPREQPLPEAERPTSRAEIEAEALDRTELDDLLAQARRLPRGRALSKQQEDILELKRQELPEAEIAQRLGVGVGAVKKQWERARTKLHRLRRAG